jgi:RimJ/RimL family protein N-acetyltransferase
MDSLRLDPRPLEGRFIRLEPFTPALRPEVQAALATDEEAWAIMVNNGGRSGFDDWWVRRMGGLAADAELPFAVRRISDGVVVGSSGYYTLRREHRGVEIGSTFYQPDARSGPVNPEAKLLLLDNAFAAGAVRVEFVTDAVNARSRAALTKLGAVEEGVLRRHKITWTGRIRDTVMFSIVDAEWPAVRERLLARLAGFSPPPA